LHLGKCPISQRGPAWREQVRGSEGRFGARVVAGFARRDALAKKGGASLLRLPIVRVRLGRAEDEPARQEHGAHSSRSHGASKNCSLDAAEDGTPGRVRFLATASIPTGATPTASLLRAGTEGRDATALRRGGILAMLALAGGASALHSKAAAAGALSNGSRGFDSLLATRTDGVVAALPLAATSPR